LALFFAFGTGLVEYLIPSEQRPAISRNVFFIDVPQG